MTPATPRAAVLLLFAAGPMFPTECDCDDLKGFVVPPDPPPPANPAELAGLAVLRYVSAHDSESGFAIEDPATGRRWLGRPSLYDHRVELPTATAAGRVCTRFEARRVGPQDAAAEPGEEVGRDNVEVCFVLAPEQGDYAVSQPRFSRAWPIVEPPPAVIR